MGLGAGRATPRAHMFPSQQGDNPGLAVSGPQQLPGTAPHSPDRQQDPQLGGPAGGGAGVPQRRSVTAGARWRPSFPPGRPRTPAPLEAPAAPCPGEAKMKPWRGAVGGEPPHPQVALER